MEKSPILMNNHFFNIKLGIRDALLTPSPRSTSMSHRSTPSPLVRRKTPLIRTPKSHSTKSALTDDLLNIPITSKRS